MQPEKKIDYNQNKFLTFLAYIRRHRGLFYIDTACAVVVALIDLLFPYVSRQAMNRYLPERLFHTFFVVMVLLVISYVGKAFLYYCITVLGHKMGVLTEADMRRDLFRHMQELSFSFYDQNRTGVLLSRIVNDLFEVTELAHHGPENLIICTLSIAGALTLMFFIQWRLALVLTIALPLGIWFTLSQRQRMRTCNIEVKKKTASITAVIESSLSGVRTAKAFANEKQELEKFDNANEIFKGAKVDYYRSMGLYMSGMEFTTGVMQVLVITVGGLLIMRGKMDYVDLISFTLYVSTFLSPLRRLVQFSEQYMQGMAGFSRFLEIMHTEPEIQDAPDAEVLGSIEGRVDINDMSFHYASGRPVLSHIDLHIRPGECLAVVGASGGGKTTLCHLIPRFYDVISGSITVDGRDIRTVTQQSLRRNIGILQQDVFMFAGTVRENIRYGRPEATDEEIVEAAKRARIHEEILAMPNGYDSYIGERGVMLSGGQKQRVAIARIFLKNPKVLILDEATSALDTVTEQSIQRSLDELSQGRTTIVIAHRLSTVRHADRIVVVERPHVAEIGTHQELMEKNGIYAGLVRAQEIN